MSRIVQSEETILQKKANDNFRIQTPIFLYDWENVWERRQKNREEGIQSFGKRGKEKDYFLKKDEALGTGCDYLAIFSC